jgi:hypothetical protein
MPIPFTRNLLAILLPRRAQRELAYDNKEGKLIGSRNGTSFETWTKVQGRLVKGHVQVSATRQYNVVTHRLPIRQPEIVILLVAVLDIARPPSDHRGVLQLVMIFWWPLGRWPGMFDELIGRVATRFGL